MAKRFWIANAILLFAIFHLSIAAGSSSTPLIDRIRAENKTGNEGFLGYTERGSVIVQSDKEIKLSIFGYDLTEIESIGFTINNDCSKVSYISHQDFLDYTDKLIVLKYKFKATKSLYKICLKLKPCKEYNGDLYKRNDILEDYLSNSIAVKEFVSTTNNNKIIKTQQEQQQNNRFNKNAKICFEIVCCFISIISICLKIVYYFLSIVMLILILIFFISKVDTLAKESAEVKKDVVALKNNDDNISKNISKWYEIMSNNKFSDIILISSDNVKIPSHRCILSKYSKIISKIIDEFTDLPVTIDIENFNAETINAALSFLYDKNDAINGKEIDVFKFALEYGIQELMDVCCAFFEKSVSSENVCEYIQIAYSNNFEELKQKCLKVLVEKKKEIDALELAVLPKNIIIDAFCL